MASGFRDMGRFSTLPYLDMKPLDSTGITPERLEATCYKLVSASEIISCCSDSTVIAPERLQEKDQTYELGIITRTYSGYNITMKPIETQKRYERGV